MGVTKKELEDRIEKLRKLMRMKSLDAVFATPGTNLFYLSGLDLWRSERLIAMFIRREGTSFLLCPSFERERVEGSPYPFDVVSWGETDDAYAMLTAEIERSGDLDRCGIEPTTWYGDFKRLADLLPEVSFSDGGAIFSKLREVKSAYEIEETGKAVRAIEGIIDETARSLREGVSEREIQGRLFSAIRERGHREGEALVQFGAGSAVPHGTPGEKRLERGEIVLFDCGVVTEGYYSDITRTFCFGQATEKMKEVYAAVYEAQRAGIGAIREGVACEEIDRETRAVVEGKGYGEYFTHRTGHGLGLYVHEEPYLVEGNRKPLVAGNIVTVEPGIYLPGRFGVRIEEDVVVTKEGSEVLSAEAPELIELAP